MSCRHECKKSPLFPAQIHNRPGLDEIDYRIGGYREMRAHILDAINKAPSLQGWTHRGVDDPGIALVESAAMVGDILAFYQRLYANESYLRTARWRESIVDLVRLLGYRLSPGVGGETTFALEVKGDAPVTVRRGFGLQAKLEGNADPAEFETRADITAHGHLSTFKLYRPRHNPSIAPGVNAFVVSQGDASAFAADDRLLVGLASPNPADPTRINEAEILVVDEVTEAFGETLVRVKGAIARINTGSPIMAYKLGRSFRHFGHTAPPVHVDASTAPATASQTRYTRPLDGDTGADTVEPKLGKTEFLMDQELDDLAVGGRILVQGKVITRTTIKPKEGKKLPLTTTTTQDRTFVRTIRSIEQGAYTWGPASGACTSVTLDEVLASRVQALHGMTQAFSADIRTLVFHEVVGEPVQLKTAYAPTAAESGKELYYYGTAAQHKALKDRRLLLVGPDIETRSVQVMSTETANAATTGQNLMRRIDVDQTVSYGDFGLDTPTVDVYGNLVEVTQGKAQREVVLGSGDQRRAFQTFAVPKTPLTYLLDVTRTPAETPELAIRVDGILWKQVDTLFDAGPDDHVYIVREDHDDNSFVQFGDGVTGSRLPSGRNNVVARYRTGTGALGELKANTTPKVTGKLKELSKAFLHQRVTGGARREEEGNARLAAPGRMQSLGRLVGLQDYESEALALPGVLKARATWTAPDGVPMLSMVVLTEGGTPDDTKKVADAMRTYNRCRGAARFPIDVLHGARQYVYLSMDVGFDPAYREADLKEAIREALGADSSVGEVSDTGLFSPAQRQFGESAHRSHIVAAVQQVDGVVWVQMKAARLINMTGSVSDPADLPIPTHKKVFTRLRAGPTRILALHSGHLVISFSKQETAAECGA